MTKAQEQRDAGTHLVKAAPLRTLICPLFTAAGAPSEDAETVAGVKEVYVAGEIEFRKKAGRLCDGIPVPDVVWRELEALAAAQHVPFELASDLG